MTLEQALFIIVSVITLGSGWIVVTNRNLFHAALAMMLSFFGVAGLYVLLDAGFMAASQLLVYIGAISILVIFAIMMTRRLMQTTESPYNSQPWFGLFTTIALFALIAIVIWQYWGDSTSLGYLAARPEVGDNILRGSVITLGQSFVSADAYVVPFELASVLLLAALIGAVLVAWPRTEDEA